MKKGTCLLAFIGSVLMVLITSNVYAQYKIKDDFIVNESGKQVGRIVGVSNLAVSDFIVYTTAGEKILSVKREEFKTPNPYYYDLFWYAIRFEDSGKEMMREMNLEYSKKGVVNKTLGRAGFIFEDKAIANQDEIIEKYSIRDSFVRDTTMIMTTHRNNCSLLKEHEIIRDRKGAITFKYDDEKVVNKITTTSWVISQAGKSIGMLERETGLNANADTYYKYTVYEEIHEGDSIEYVSVGFGHVGETTLKFKTVIDNKTHAISRGNISAKDEPGQSILRYLISSNYL